MSEWIVPVIAEMDAGQVLIVIAVLVMSALGAIFEKLKQKPHDKAQRRPPVVPPVPREETDRLPVPRPARQRRPSSKPRPAEPRRPRPPELRPAQMAPTPAERIAGALQQAVYTAQPEESLTTGLLVQLQPTKSLSEVRAEQEGIALPVGPGGSRSLTLADLRQAIVLNEILSPPMGLRDDRRPL